VSEPIVSDNRRFAIAVAVFFLCGVAVAVVAGLAMATARQADQRSIQVAQQQLAESQDNLVRAQVAACESRDRSRADTRAVWDALLDLIAEGGGDSPTAAQFRVFVHEAYDPINCVWGSPDFNVDVDPATLPPFEQGGF
jgi:cobalamin biosynthesis protein CobD/CbiB